jgi:hypothetical protein
MIKIKKFLRLGFLTDKQAHALYGFLFFFACLHVYSIHVSLGLTVVLGAFVEAYDRISGKGTPEFLDFVYTIGLPLLLYLLHFLL